MEYVKDKELRRLVTEIVVAFLALIILTPMWVNASNNYRTKKDVLLKGTGTSVDITYKGDMKEITIYSNHYEPVKVNLVFKISKLKNEYRIYLDDNSYNLSDIESTSDGEYQYYNLGIYEVNKTKKLDFKLEVIEDTYYDETITYSFITEGIFSGNERLS